MSYFIIPDDYSYFLFDCLVKTLKIRVCYVLLKTLAEVDGTTEINDLRMIYSLNSLMNTHEDFSLEQFQKFIEDNLVDADELIINAYKSQLHVLSLLQHL